MEDKEWEYEARLLALLNLKSSIKKFSRES